MRVAGRRWLCPAVAEASTVDCPAAVSWYTSPLGTGATPTTNLSPNQLGRLWHPCDAVVAPVPACVRD